MIYGYARVSMDGQSVDAQVTQLTAAGAGKVFREVASGAKTDRAQLRRVLDQLDEVTRDGLMLSPQTIAEIDKAERRRSRWTMIALWVIAALLAWIVFRLL